MSRERVPAHALQRGDRVGSGETVVDTYGGIRVPPRKIRVVLDGPRGRRVAEWGKHTLIGVQRANANS